MKVIREVVFDKGNAQVGNCYPKPLPTCPVSKGHENLHGVTFGNVVAVGVTRASTNSGKARWLCKCKCGSYCCFVPRQLKDPNWTAMCGQCSRDGHLRASEPAAEKGSK